jgi:hypothetical protein
MKMKINWVLVEGDWGETIIQNFEHTVASIMLVEKWQKGITEVSHFCEGLQGE